MRDYPALRLDWPPVADDDLTGQLLAEIDDCHPTALEVNETGARIFFAAEHDRDRAEAVVADRWPSLARTVEAVSDGDWARRSQAALTAIDIGRLRIAPPWLAADPIEPERITIVIQPSTGFGTGHHATTRLCLRLLERHVAAGVRTIDIGTGSGVLAIAARRLGAREALGIDHDPDALDNARENIELNGIDGVQVELADAAKRAAFGEPCDLATANLTGALLCRIAPDIVGKIRPGGIVIASGYQVAEREPVTAALVAAGTDLVEALEEEDWIGAAFRRRD